MQLHNKSISPIQEDNWPSEDNQAIKFDVDRLLGIARRQWRIVAYFAAGAAAIGVIYVLNATPLYTAKTSVMIDRGSNAVLEQLTTVASVLDDEGSVLSQVELLKSETIGLAVVNKEKLYDDREFLADNGSVLGTIRGVLADLLNVSNWFVSRELTSEEQEANRRAAVGKLSRNTEVQRVGRTYVLEVSYTSASPQMASRIANAIGEAYLTDKLDSKFDATRRAGEWFQDRIAELRDKARDADLAVQKYKTENGLVSSGTVLSSDQRLSELNTALTAARTETAKARARSEGINRIIAAGEKDAIVTDALDSAVINDLRKKYLESAKIETEISNRLGENHTQAVRLRAEMSEYKRLMFEELNRIAESYKSDLEVAEAKEKSASQSVTDATGVSAVANESQVRLRELERDSDVYRELSQSFMKRYQDAESQQSFPATDARIISRAGVPERPSYPKKLLSLLLFTMVGGAAGAAAGAFREYRDRFFRTGEQLRNELGLEFLGMAPLITDEKLLPADDKMPVSIEGPTIRRTSSITNYVSDHPLSAFAEALRSAKIAADLSFPSKQCKIIGIVSTLPSEGKSTVAINFAELLANQGARTLLIDADLRNPGATRALARHATVGLLEAILDGKPIQDLLLFNPRSKLAFLPAVIKQRVPHSSELLTSPAMQRMLNGLSAKLDYIILDLPPLAPVVDARAMASRVDGFLYVVEWGGIARRTVRHTLSHEPQIAEKCLGVLLNKVDLEKMKLYRPYGSVDYYYSRYSQYYHEG